MIVFDGAYFTQGSINQKIQTKRYLDTSEQGMKNFIDWIEKKTELTLHERHFVTAEVDSDSQKKHGMLYSSLKRNGVQVDIRHMKKKGVNCQNN